MCDGRLNGPRLLRASEPLLAGEPVQVAQRTFVEGELLEIGQLAPFAVSNLPALEGSLDDWLLEEEDCFREFGVEPAFWTPVPEGVIDVDPGGCIKRDE